MLNNFKEAFKHRVSGALNCILSPGHVVTTSKDTIYRALARNLCCLLITDRVVDEPIPCCLLPLFVLSFAPIRVVACVII